MKVIQEEDRPDSRAILVVVGIMAGLCLLGLVLAIGVERWAASDLTRSDVVFNRRLPVVAEAFDRQPNYVFQRPADRVPAAVRPPELDGYGWIDRERGVVRIPIARAKDLLVERGTLEGGVARKDLPQVDR
jgi:hypothetical protein